MIALHAALGLAVMANVQAAEPPPSGPEAVPPGQAPGAPPGGSPAPAPAPASAADVPAASDAQPAPWDAPRAEPAASGPAPSGELESVDTSEQEGVERGSGLFEDSLGGGEDTEDSPASGFDVNGYVRGDLWMGKVPGKGQGLLKAGYGELALKVQTPRESYGSAFAEARLRYGQQDRARDLFLELREAYVDGHFGPLDLRLGQQIIVWGRADAFNPTNNLTPIDLRIRSPIEDDRRLGNVGARAFLNFLPLRLEGVFMPIYAPTEYPTIELDEFIVIGDPDYPAPELGRSLGAARVHLELPSVEMSASYLRGYAPLPGLALQSYTVGVSPPEIRISRTAYNHHVVGFDFSTAVGDVFALRGEAAYRRPIQYEERVYAPRPDLQYVLGVDRMFGSVNVIVQYVGRYVFDWQRELGPEDPVAPSTLADWTPPLPKSLRDQVENSINSELRVRNQIVFAQTEEVQHVLSARLEWVTLHETLSVSALGMVNVSTKEWLVYPKLSYRISDTMSTAVGAEIYKGPDDTLFGLIDEELSAGYAELRVSF